MEVPDADCSCQASSSAEELVSLAASIVEDLPTDVRWFLLGLACNFLADIVDVLRRYWWRWLRDHQRWARQNGALSMSLR